MTKEKSVKQKRSVCRTGSLICSGIFLVFVFLYSWLLIKPHLIHHSFGLFLQYPSFTAEWQFLKEYLVFPGGLMEYISAFLSQWFFYSWLGALIITLTAWLMCVGTSMALALFGARRSRFLCCIPPLALLMMYSRYSHPLTICLALLTALWFFVVYGRVNIINRFCRAAVFTAMVVVLYGLASASCLLFVVLVCLYEIIVHRKVIFGLYCLAAGVAMVWIVGVYFADFVLKDAYTRMLPIMMKGDLRLESVSTKIAQGMYLFVPAAMLVMGLWHGKRDIKSKPAGSLAKSIFYIVLLVVCVSVCLYRSYNGSIRKSMHLDYLGRREKWQLLLKYADQLPPEILSDKYCLHEIDKALYYTGRLEEDLFKYRQTAQSAQSLLLVFGEKACSNIYLKRMNLFLELGYVCTAERGGYEILELRGNWPIVLKQLATINLVKGYTETARVFLEVLKKDLVYGDEAAELLQQINEDPALSANKHIQYLRSVVIDKDSTAFEFNADDFFNQLLEKNRKNRMAFEYMMAFYLLTNQAEKIAKNIWRLHDFDYKKLPSYYEEALVVYMGPDFDKLDFDPAWRPGADAIARAKKFEALCIRYGPNLDIAKEILRKEFGDSYYFYRVFKESGVNR